MSLLYLSPIKKTIISSCLLLSLSGGVNAALYDSGALNFSTEDQSMWATGDAFVESNSVFLGAEWEDRTATVGGFVGEASKQVQETTAAWFVWNVCKTTVNVLCGAEPIRTVTVTTLDTRTGAEVSIQSTGKVGLEFGYSVNSGSVDAAVEFSALAELPDQPVYSGDNIDINSTSSLDGGSIQTQSPEIEAYISAILNLSGSVDAEACVVGACTSGSTDLPTIELDQSIISIDPGSIKILDGVLPGDEPLAEIPLLNQSLTLSGGATLTDPPIPVLELSTSLVGVPDITNQPPGTTAVVVDLAEISVNVPNIATSGELEAGQITSDGEDELLNLQLDIDGLATVLAYTPVVGATLDLSVAEVHIDLIDVDMGPKLNVTQDFELVSTLMATLEFSSSVLIDGIAGLQDSWTGAWADLPDFSLFETTVFSPTYWVDVMLENDFGLSLGLTGTLDILQVSVEDALGIVGLGPLSLNGLLGLGNTLFDTPTLGFSVAKDEFTLSGFNQIVGNAFTIDVLAGQSNPNNPTSVPEPGILWLFGFGLIPVIVARRRSRLLTSREA